MKCGRRAIAVALLAALPPLVTAPSDAHATADGTEPRRLRYGLAAGQNWRCTHSVERELRYAGETRAERGETVVRYRVGPGEEAGWYRLRASILSQSRPGGFGADESGDPLSLASIHFEAELDGRGVARGGHYRVDPAEPPELPDLPRDPAAYQALRESFAAAWLATVFWLPELPEAPLSVGDAFEVVQNGPVGGAPPGVEMIRTSKQVYTLRAVRGDRARFGIRSDTAILTRTGESELSSRSEAEGSAVFDLERGMWLRREMSTRHRAEFSGAQGLADGETSAITRSTTEMEPDAPL